MQNGLETDVYNDSDDDLAVENNLQGVVRGAKKTLSKV